VDPQTTSLTGEATRGLRASLAKRSTHAQSGRRIQRDRLRQARPSPTPGLIHLTIISRGNRNFDWKASPSVRIEYETSGSQGTARERRTSVQGKGISANGEKTTEREENMPNEGLGRHRRRAKTPLEDLRGGKRHRRVTRVRRKARAMKWSQRARCPRREVVRTSKWVRDETKREQILADGVGLPCP